MMSCLKAHIITLLKTPSLIHQPFYSDIFPELIKKEKRIKGKKKK